MLIKGASYPLYEISGCKLFFYILNTSSSFCVYCQSFLAIHTKTEQASDSAAVQAIMCRFFYRIDNIVVLEQWVARGVILVIKRRPTEV